MQSVTGLYCSTPAATSEGTEDIECEERDAWKTFVEIRGHLTVYEPFTFHPKPQEEVDWDMTAGSLSPLYLSIATTQAE